MITIYIDCTHTYAAEVLTGIQRVVRSIVGEAQLIGKVSESVEVVPVVLIDQSFVAVSSIPDHYYQQAVTSDQTVLAIDLSFISFLTIVRRFVRTISTSRWGLSILKLLRQYFPSLFAVAKNTYTKIKLKLGGHSSLQKSAVSFHEGDVLLLLDSSWDISSWQPIIELNEKSVRVFSVVYDLIPIHYPQFCDQSIVDMFSDFYHHAIKYVDGFIAISSSVMEDMKVYVKLHAPERFDVLQFSYFYLGADFYQSQAQQSIRPDVISVYARPEQHYLMVSTIEPRKNHRYLLDTFDQLWQLSVPVTLTIVGRVGWMVDDIIDRLKKHPELGRYLFVFHNLTDAELSYCYQHATALVFPSITEGFGLPIIEALQHGLPVIVSDIPVHREIGGDIPYYVDIDNSQALVELIKTVQQLGIEAQHRPTNAYHWLSWHESAYFLLNKIVDMAEKKE